MPDRLVIHLPRRVRRSSCCPPGAVRRRSCPLAAGLALDAAMLADLRWYLEDYLLTPYGAWEERGPAVQERLAGWGDAVFGAVFGSGPARLAYERAWERGLPVMLRSADPGRLKLPWELMRDSVGPVALGAGGICRGGPAPDAPGTLDVPGTRLRVLMVSSGPAGADDTGYHLLARPLLERLTAVRGDTELTILRPTTFAALAEAVRWAAGDGEPFHVVHFDGYGMMPGSPAWNRETAGGRQTVTAAAGEGVLGFARPGGGRDYVGVSKIAAALAGARLPLAVLGACQPGAVGKDLEVSFATALLSAGCAAVVTMAYSLAAVAAAEFMVSFYESLLAGDRAGQAVAAGRRRLSARDGRPSPRGSVPLADWLVPVLYLGRDIRFTQAHTARPPAARSLAGELDRIGAASRGPGVPRQPLMPAGAFVSRDGLLHQLETAALARRVVVLTGLAGSGKTELAKAFARWWRDTGGTDDKRLVLWHSFEPGAADPGLDAVVTAIGLAVFGAAFAGLDPEQRLARVRQLLSQRRALLVWDHFEPPPQAPDSADAPPPPGNDRHAALLDFLEWVRDHSVSTVIITSRATEERLGLGHHVRVGALNQAEAAEYASHQIAPFPSARRRRQHRSFGELLAWLDGDPSAIQLAIARLETTDPAGLLPGLRRAAQAPADGEGDGQTPFAACVRDAFGRLPETALRLLPALSLLQGIADVNV